MDTVKYDLERFLKAQEYDYEIALSEIKAGEKRSHWIWYIFPQLKGLGFSEMSDYYGISGRKEALAYYNDPVLGQRLKECVEELMKLDKTDPVGVMGYTDALKLCSCLTLFELVSGDPLLSLALEKFYKGKRDGKTVSLLSQ